ncbi:MAG: hypothetical protein H7Z38_22385 [Rubrivivax sp.]|nr:hypothetical protein [Pyrinomonadaceae bacterium]
MKNPISFLLLILLTLHATTPLAAATRQDAVKPAQPPAATAAQALTNEDVLKMVEAKLAPEVIVEKIRTSACSFETTPEALQKLKDAGIPDSVLLVMVVMPNSAANSAVPAQPRKVSVKIPEGTPVELETAYTINSQLVRKGDAITFRVVNPVVVEGAVVIEKGATATALITKSERGGHFGRAGRIAWTMKEVTAADGSRIPVQFSGRTVGDSKGAKVATQMVVMGVMLWPIAPVILFRGFKRGENAVVPEGKRFDAVVFGTVTVSATARQ